MSLGIAAQIFLHHFSAPHGGWRCGAVAGGRNCLAVIRCLALHLDREHRRSLSLCSEVASERERG
jgi:hypothetical protein